MGDSISASELAAIALVVGLVAVAMVAGIWLNSSAGRRRRRRKSSHRIDLFARQREREAANREEQDGS